MTDLTGKIALITGSARGISKAIAERYGARGASIVVNYSRDWDRANATVDNIERLGGTAIAIQADVSKVADIERLFAATVAHFGRLDIVVANAGVELVDIAEAIDGFNDIREWIEKLEKDGKKHAKDKAKDS